MTRDISTGMLTSLERVSMAGVLETDSLCLRVDLSTHKVKRGTIALVEKFHDYHINVMIELYHLLLDDILIVTKPLHKY